MQDETHTEGHRLTQLSVPSKRGFERRTVGVPCRLSFTLKHMRDVRVVFAITQDISRGGALLQLREPMGEVRYLNIEFAPRTPAVPAIVRRHAECAIGCEFLEPMSAERFLQVLALAESRA